MQNALMDADFHRLLAVCGFKYNKMPKNHGTLR